MRVGTTEIVLVRGDITRARVDAVVNAANPSLLGGGGVDGAIHRAGGPEVLRACRRIREKRGRCPTGEAVITTGGDLPARYVVHTVGPVWHGGAEDEEALLRSCHTRSLALAAEHGARSIAFPALSTGAFGYPIDRAAPVALRAAIEYAREHGPFEEIRFVLFSEGDLEAYRTALAAEETTR